ncbi:MAG: ComEC/Rec2 family competence protein [Candidatus Subteraquimicrobiales bacterium]|nr:ComEC/Rec2 family competence protein [Candidatus Subteraquimicrobiales bacterium]
MAKGLLLGGSQGFSSEFLNAIKNSGTSHLVAVSGYNVSIITIILFRYIRAAFSRRSAIIFSIIFLICFCLLSGATASVVRASLMGLMYIIAKIIGRRGAIVNSLFVAAFFMLILNPFALWDIGFELSFMATFGLIFLGEPMIKLFFGRLKDGTAKDVASTLCETISAQLFTLPILLSAFGKISIIAPIANVLILLLVPLAMLLIFISVIGAFLWQNIGLLLAGVAYVLLDYFMTVIKFFGSLKMAAMQISISNPLVIIGMYFAIFALAVYVRKIKSVKAIKLLDINSKL